MTKRSIRGVMKRAMRDYKPQHTLDNFCTSTAKLAATAKARRADMTELKPCPFCGGNLRPVQDWSGMWQHPRNGCWMADISVVGSERALVWNTRAMSAPAPTEGNGEPTDADKEALMRDVDKALDQHKKVSRLALAGLICNALLAAGWRKEKRS
jgi:hypothetical protein